MAQDNCCGDSIFNKQNSTIPSPSCADDCPEDLGCSDILPAACVTVATLTGCIDSAPNLQDTLQNIATYVCNINPVSTDEKVKIDEDDTTAGYLEDKLVSDCFDITQDPAIGDKKLRIEPKVLTWLPITINSAGGWATFSDAADAAYAIDCNGKVWFRGTIANSSYTLDDTILQTTAANKPFDVTATAGLSSAILAGLTSIGTRGIGTMVFQFTDTSRVPLAPNMKIKTDGSTIISKNYVGDGGETGTMILYLDGYSIES